MEEVQQTISLQLAKHVLFTVLLNTKNDTNKMQKLIRFYFVFIPKISIFADQKTKYGLKRAAGPGVRLKLRLTQAM